MGAAEATDGEAPAGDLDGNFEAAAAACAVAHGAVAHGAAASGIGEMSTAAAAANVEAPMEDHTQAQSHLGPADM